MNRGIAHRTVFETRADIRMFLAQVAKAVRHGLLEVHSYSILTTHFHLLVRSPSGQLSFAMQRIQNEYVRWFNYGRRRDGPLFRGRFCSRRVTSDVYRRVLIRYIDDNPVAAGIVADALEYPHGSACWHCRSEGPPWLTRSWIEKTVSAACERPFSGADYAKLFARPLDESARSWIEWISRQDSRGQDDLDRLLDAASTKVRAWIRERTKVADGTAVGFPVCMPQAVHRAVDASFERAAGVRTGHRSGLEALELRAVLLFECCGMSQGEISRVCGMSKGTVALACRRHRLRTTDEEYLECVADVVVEALKTDHLGHVIDLPSEVRVRVSMRKT